MVKMADILILHGWGSSAKNWGRVKELLEKRGDRVFVPDLPGFGESPAPEKPWAIDDYVDWVKQHIDQNLTGQLYLIGHSFGGATAIKYAIKYPQGVQKLILVAASYRRRKTVRRLTLSITAKCFKVFSFLPFYNLFRRAFYKFIVGKSDYPHAAGVMKETYLKIIQEDLTGIVSSVKIPTLIIWGEKDSATPIENALLLNKSIKNSEVAIIENGDHDLERKVPEILAEKIINFLT